MHLRDYQQAAVEAAIAHTGSPAIIDLPTGSGKSHVIAAIAEHYHSEGKRVMVIAHRKELLEQTGAKFKIDVGYYSASIGERELEKQITIAGIQSVYNKEVAPLDVIILDECHMLPNSRIGQYWKFIDKHPQAKLIGLSATCFRLKGGKLSWGEIVHKTTYEELLNRGFLAPLSNKLVTSATPDLSTIQVKLGEYVQAQLEAVMEDPALIEAAVKSIIAYSKGRHSCLIFCVSVAHALLLQKVLGDNGVQSSVVTGSTKMEEREAIIEQFKADDGTVRYLINCEVFTVGFDAPNVDMIVCLRPTKSKVLWEQICGRAVRIFDGKENALLVDMAGNLEEHGAIGTPLKQKSKKEAEQNKHKICPQCEEYVKPLTKECPDCGYAFPEAERPKVVHQYEANQTAAAVHSRFKKYRVLGVTYAEHINRKNGNVSMRVDYACNHGKYKRVSEWVSTLAPARARAFFSKRGVELQELYPVDRLIGIAQKLNKPTFITVDTEAEFPTIISYEWGDEAR